MTTPSLLELNANLLADIGGWPALKEARALVARGRVTEARREGAVLRARVQGGEKVYDAQITLADRVANIEVRCTCAESRRTGRVCAHALAAGLAVIGSPSGSRRPPGDGSVVAVAGPRDGPRSGSPDNLLSGSPQATGGSQKILAPNTNSAQATDLKRFTTDDAPPGTPLLEITVLLPLQLPESLARDPVRVILEARRGAEAPTQPWDAVVRELKDGYAVSEEDERILAALEQLTGTVSGVNAVPRVKMGNFLRALDAHPRVWLGKKQRLEVRATAERPRIIFRTRDDGALELSARPSPTDFLSASVIPSLSRDQFSPQATPMADEAQLPRQVRPQVQLGNEETVAGSRRPPGDGSVVAAAVPSGGPSHGVRRLPMDLPLPSWSFDGETLTESPALPAGFSSDTGVIPPAQIPDFLSREFPALERNCELVFAPGFEEFQLEIGTPMIEARLDGASSGLTLELIAHYGHEEREKRGQAPFSPASAAGSTSSDEKGASPLFSATETFSLNGKTESSAYQRYVPDARKPNRFWRRNILAEREALAQVEAAGFSLVRSGAATFSLIQENQVARFLANTLPRWRRAWTVTFGSRLEATLQQIDIAEPEFSLRANPGSGSGEDWLSLDLKLSVGGKPVPLDQSEIQRWLQTGQSHARTANKRVLLIPTEAWGEMQETLVDCAVEQEPGKIRVKKTYAPFLTGALTAQGFRAEGDVAVLVRAWPTPDVKAHLDEKLWTQLRPYQAHGVEWLAGLAQQDFHGLLADDMGLGKTLQALAFAAWLHQLGRDGCPQPSVESSFRDAKGLASLPQKVLVVCPTSLVTNWLREAARFTPHLRALDLTGADRAEKWAKRHDYDLLVTSYAILRRDVELYRSEEFSLVILDEAQQIKNRGSQNAQSAKALRAKHRLILTGTPLENSVLDLWSLFDFLLPGYLGTATEFRERYETPLTRGPEPKVMERLRQRVKPFFLRRTKEEVLTELPPKLEHLALCELTDEQREVYRAVLAQGRREVFEHSDKAGRKSGGDRLAALTTLLRLRQVCCHLDLLPGGEGRSEKEEGRSKKAGDSALHPSTFTLLPSSGRWKEPSAKMERTFELIDEAIDGGYRVLLFSQFVRVLHLLRDEATRRELRFCYLDGQTVERQAEVDRFQNDAGIPLFFISLKAGGTGLNLTGADTVIHFDPWWNPAVEEQATSRAHRMGQSRHVQAYKLIAAGTVEEKIQALQARKRELFEASLGGDAAFVEKLTGEDLEELLEE